MLDSAEARLDGSIVARFAEVALIFGVALAVLAFGGTEPVSFALVQIIFLATAVLLVAKMPQSLAGSLSAWGFVVPAVLAAVVLTQLIPLPAHLALSMEPYATRTHFLILLTCVIAFYLAQMVSENRKRKERLIVSLLALGTVAAFYGLVQYLSGWQHIFFFVKKYDLEEATGTYINRNHFAGMLEMILPFSLWLLYYDIKNFLARETQPPLIS